MKNHENVPAIIQPKTTRTTAVTTIIEGFFFSIKQAKSKLDKGRSLLKTLYLKIWALSISESLSGNDPDPAVLEILNSKFCLQYWTLGARELSTSNVGRLFFLQPTPKYLATCRKKPTGLMLGPLSTKNDLCSRKISFFQWPKPQAGPSFLPGIIEWVKFKSVHDNLLWK